ncbi:MAG: hypothetical protein R6V34_00400 [Bacteroidales bacterium]
MESKALVITSQGHAFSQCPSQSRHTSAFLPGLSPEQVAGWLS